MALALLPVLFVALVVSALLYGTGHELPFVNAFEARPGETDGREAVAWAAGVVIALVFALPVVGAVGQLIEGRFFRLSHDLEKRLAGRYGFALVLWPRLLALCPERERAQLVAAGERARTHALVAAGWFVAAAGALFTAIVFFDASALLVPLVVAAVVFGLSSQRSAVTSEREHLAAIETTVDLHRLALIEAVGWQSPRSGEEEKEMLSALSRSIVEGVPAPDRFRRPRHETSPGDDMLEEFKSSVEDTLRTAVAGPPLANFDGHLSVELCGDGKPVTLEDGHVARLWPEVPYELHVRIGDEARGALSAPLRVRGGVDQEEVLFTVSVDTNARGVARAEAETTAVRGRSDAVAVFPLEFPVGPQGDVWLWVRASQRGRTLQNVGIDVRFPAVHA